MKYRQLTKEQFESLHKEFAHFLASQSIDKKEWKQIIKLKPHIAEEEMNIFSDMVWDDVLTKVAYLEHFSEKTINLFKCNKQELIRIVIKTTSHLNFLNTKDYNWLLKNTQSKDIEYFTGVKKYTTPRNSEVFDLIEKGCTITKGKLFEYFNTLITNKK